VQLLRRLGRGDRVQAERRLPVRQQDDRAGRALAVDLRRVADDPYGEPDRLAGRGAAALA